jgi:hypothetical protein
VKEDQIPLPFKTFYAIFNSIQRVIAPFAFGEVRSASDATEYRDENIPKITNIMTVPQSHPFMQRFCHSRPTNDKEVIRALKKFQLREEFSNKNLGNEAKMLTLNKDFIKHLEGDKNPKPDEWTIHHMIPSKTIVEFYTNYFKLLSQKSSEMVKHKRFDWIKINEITVQKVFLVDAETLWTKYGPKDVLRSPVYNYDKNKNSGQEDFVRAWYRWPIGLLFYGPRTNIRKDDPSKNKKMYNYQPNDFELFAASIVGDEYFEKAKILNTDILNFNKMFTSSSDKVTRSLDLNKEAMKVYIRILTIHREAPWSNQIIAPFNTDGWNVNTEEKLWSINQNYRPNWGEWGIKALTQQSHLLALALDTNDVNVGASTSSFKELRRKRHNDQRSFEELKCVPGVPESVSHKGDVDAPKNGFWCSPFYLRINPVNYIVCKLLGHKNLSFF